MTPPAAPPSRVPERESAQQQTPAPQPKSILGLIACVAVVVGFILACIPGAFIVGWIFFPVAFSLALVSLFMKGQRKGLGITALVLSVVGAVVGVWVVFAFVVHPFQTSFGAPEPTVVVPDGHASARKGDKPGTRENPAPIGTTITQGSWTVSINSVNLEANEAIARASLTNDPAPEGRTFILVNATATYNGAGPAGQPASMSVEYVTPNGDSVAPLDHFVVAPDPFDLTRPLAPGASTTGNFALAVPVDSLAEGALAVSARMLGEEVFIAVR